MPSLTRQEKWIIIFLGTLILVGLGVNHYKKLTIKIETKIISSLARKENFPSSAQKLIDINTASLEELIKLKGIGKKTAQYIIDYRVINGPFSRIEDIQNVKGIGPKKFDTIRKSIAVN